jgi:hypothetical protein
MFWRVESSPSPVAPPVRGLADRAQVLGGEDAARELDPEHECPDLRLVVVQPPPLEADDVLLRDALVAGRDESRELVPDPERRLLLLDPLHRVSLQDEAPGGGWLLTNRASDCQSRRDSSQ